MKRKLEQLEHEDTSEIESEDDDNLEEEDEISQKAEELSRSIPNENALDLLHSMAASKDILYWNSYGEMTYHHRRIPVTSINELLEYALLPYNPDVRPPRGLQTFTNGLIELGIDKKVIRNQKLLVDLVARQPEDEDSDDSSTEVESDSNSDRSDENDNHGEYEKDYYNTITSADESVDDNEEEEQQECHVCEDVREFSKILVAECPNCFWHEGYLSQLDGLLECKICRSAFRASPLNIRKLFYSCNNCRSLHRLSLKSHRLKLIAPEHANNVEEET